jgi:branched-chain amino acid transport system permease protein
MGITGSGLVDVAIGGLTVGSVYAVLAIGFSLIYGVSGVFNYAYGSFFTWAAYIAWLAFTAFAWMNYPIAIVFTFAGIFLLALIVDRFLIRPLRWKPDPFTNIVFITLALALFLDNMALCIFGPQRKALPSLMAGTVSPGGFTISWNDIVVFLICIGLVVGLLLFLARTRSGMAMRAVGQDKTGAQIVGIPVNTVFAYTFAISVVMAGMAAVLLAPKHFIYPEGGWDILIKAFIIAVVGGIGSIGGTLAAAFILGMVEVFVFYFAGATWILPSWFLILIIILIVRPKGLFIRRRT